MSTLIDRLGELLSQQLPQDAIGQASRVEGLSGEEGRQLSSVLKARIESYWDVMFVCADAADIEDPSTDVSVDVAIERRNDKSKNRLFIMPRELEAEAAASLADTQPYQVAGLQRVLVDGMVRKLPGELKGIVQTAFRRTPLSSRFEFLLATDGQTELYEFGKEFWRLGLVPDLAPTADRISRNRDCVDTLTEPSIAALSPAQLVDEIGLTSNDLKKKLIELLRKYQTDRPDKWLREISESPDLTFDKWSLRGEPGGLKQIFVLSFRSTSLGVHAWSGLELEEGTLRVKAAKQPKVTIRWQTDPLKLNEEVRYEVSVETCEPVPTPLVTDKVKHKRSETQSWSFNPNSVVSDEDSGLLVRVRIRAMETEKGGESEEFLLRAISDFAPPILKTPFVRSLPDLMLQAARDKVKPEISSITLGPNRDAPMWSSVQLQEKRSGRIAVSPILARFQQFGIDPRFTRRCDVPLESNDQWSNDDLSYSESLLDPDSFGSDDFWRRRRQIIDAIKKTIDGNGGLVEATTLEPLREQIMAYGRAYSGALEKIVAAGSRDAIGDALLIDSIRLVDKERKLQGVILSPLHPVRLTWHLAHELLVRTWINEHEDSNGGIALPTDSICQDLNAANWPAFLAVDDMMLRHVDSPLIHWPLYAVIDSTISREIASRVRYALGHSKVEVNAPGRELAVERLAGRIRTYQRLHPQVRTLSLNAVNIGDGRILLDAISSSDVSAPEVPGDADEPSGGSMAYDLCLYGDATKGPVGTYFDECVALHRSGEPLSAAISRLLEPTGDGDYLRPHLAWATRGIDSLGVITGSGVQDAHISLLVDFLEARKASVADAREDSSFSLSSYGLQCDLVTTFRDEDEDWVWFARIQEPGKIASHPSEKTLTSLLVRLQKSTLGAVRAALALPESSLPACSVGYDGRESAHIERLHDASDWVITVDKSLVVDMFDWPSASSTRMRAIGQKYLIDFVPEPVGPAGQQMMISTAWTDEIAGLIGAALRDMGILPSDLACEAVLDVLKSVSGELAMRLSQYRTLASEAVSLAIVRDVLRGKGELERAFLVPVDEHIDLLSASRSRTSSQSARRVDLLLVQPARGREPAKLNFIEVKYRRQLSVATDPHLWRDMHEASSENQKWLKSLYFGAPAENLALPLSRRRLAGLFETYARRAHRYRLMGDDELRDAIKWCESLKHEHAEVEFSQRGFVYCSEQEDSEQSFGYGDSGFDVTVIGRNAVRRYTSLELEEAQESEHFNQIEGNSSALGAEAPEEAGLPEQEKAPESTPPESADERPAEIEVTLGHEQSKSAPVLFKPTTKANPHLLIVGIPGMGKTTSVLNTCQQLAPQGVSPFVIDFHGDLAAGLSKKIPGAIVLDAGSGLDFNPLELDNELRQEPQGWKHHFYEVAEIFGDLFPAFGELQINDIRDALRECYEDRGFGKDYESAKAPSFNQFWQKLQQNAVTRRDLRKIVARLQPMFDLTLFSDGNDAMSFERLSSSTTIVDLHRLRNQENQQIAASFLLQRIYRGMFNVGPISKLRHVVVLDEAHRLASLGLIERLMKESRKYGTMCILSSQRVDDFRSGVLESAGSYLCLRVNHPDAKCLAQYLSPDESGRKELQGSLMTLTRYHALFQTEDPDAPAGRPKRVVLAGNAVK